MTKILTLTIALVATGVAIAEDDLNLTVEPRVSGELKLNFPNDDNIQPRKSSFRVLNFVLMSNELGERWAIVTLKNSSTTKRTFDHEQLMALFADGMRREPLAYKAVFDGLESQSLTISFGFSKFPILDIYTRE